VFTSRPEISGTFGVAASTHWIATGVAMSVLERGGNAFDAAAAAGFTLQVVEPHMNGPAGEVPIIFYDATSCQVRVACGQGPAPGAASVGHFERLGLDLIPGTGLLAACVPGAFDAWMLLLQEHGSWALKDILAPAISYAEFGHPITAGASEVVLAMRDMFQQEWTTSAAVYIHRGAAPVPGRLFRNTTLANTFKRIIAEAEAAGTDRNRQIDAARTSWSNGFVAESIDLFCQESQVLDTSGRRHSGVLTGTDISSWKATFEDPVEYDYYGYTVCKCGPWSQGPVFLGQLALLKQFNLETMDPYGAEFVHTVTECAKLAFADREVFFGDPKITDVPLSTLLSEDYNKARQSLILDTASVEHRPGAIDGFGGTLRIGRHTGNALMSGVGEPSQSMLNVTRGDTCHLDVIDTWGNIVSATPSGGWLQGSPVISDLGFPLGTRAQMFWLDQDHPNGLVPGKRPRTTLSPSLALKNGRPYMAFGTPGGDQQDQWSLVFFLRHVHHGLNLQESIDASAFHTNHFPSSFYPRNAQPGHLAVEGRFPSETISNLQERGHKLELADPWSCGRLSACTWEEGLLKAGANPRGMQGYAAGR